MSFFLARRRVFSGLKGVKVVQMVIPSRWNSCIDPDITKTILLEFVCRINYPKFVVYTLGVHSAAGILSDFGYQPLSLCVKVYPGKCKRYFAEDGLGK